MKKLNKKGFTLVELLAVIVILALLMVVATRTIGGSLANSRRSGLQTEAKKLLSKSYEDIQEAIMMGYSTPAFTYVEKAADGTAATIQTSGTTHTIKLKDGQFNAVITFTGNNTNYKITDICINDGNNNIYDKEVTNGNTVTFTEDEAYADTTGTYKPSCYNAG